MTTPDTPKELRDSLIDAVESAIGFAPMDPIHATDRHCWGGSWHMDEPPEPREDHYFLQGRASCAARAVDVMLPRITYAERELAGVYELLHRTEDEKVAIGRERDELRAEMQEMALQALSDQGQWIEETAGLRAKVAELEQEQREVALQWSEDEQAWFRERAELQALVEAGRVDAERYRGLRVDTAISAIPRVWSSNESAEPVRCLHGDELDAAIDSARAPAAGGEEKP